MTELKKIQHYNFYQLVELLYQIENKQVECEKERLPSEEFIRFSSCASLGFPSSDVVSLKKDKRGYDLEVAFMGLHGSQSPLPGYYLERLAWEYAQQDGNLYHFIDFFNHRFLMLLHLAWRKYRYYIRYQADGNDGFSQMMFSLVGLGSRTLRDVIPVNHSKMLAYSGLLAAPGRSPDVVSGLISHCFDLPNVEVESWQYRRVSIVPHQQNRLGEVNSDLRGNFVIGDYSPDVCGKFTLCIHDLSHSHFLRFLPNGDLFRPLVTFVAFILRDQLAWDLQLGLAPKQSVRTFLGHDKGCLLGWTTFLGQPPVIPRVIISVQE
ncbi:type VI secretion system baseplate subunit TssG [Hafnia alvei]|uniref:type VI secretion system baseplate subunit TssG n=1 Tax=Hafnia alvei TaxID=569 RepID=UPI0009BD0AFB|nr:type VI secretion system baseplate subunit TssG [Hafnia alvei]